MVEGPGFQRGTQNGELEQPGGGQQEDHPAVAGGAGRGPGPRQGGLPGRPLAPGPSAHQEDVHPGRVRGHRQGVRGGDEAAEGGDNGQHQVGGNTFEYDTRKTRDIPGGWVARLSRQTSGTSA